jgi:hypothetical protein
MTVLTSASERYDCYEALWEGLFKTSHALTSKAKARAVFSRIFPAGTVTMIV